MPNVIRSTVSLDFQLEAEHGEFQNKGTVAPLLFQNWEPIVLFTFLCCEIIIFRFYLRCMIWSSLEKKPPKTCPLIHHGFTKKRTQPRTVFSFTPHNKLHTFPDRKDGLGDKAFLFVWKGDLFRGCCYLQLMLFCFKYGL